ncbi:hypothetical protein ACIBK8_22470 [Streptomyces sp. NPDC050161]|uniref:hypothetical protein n=1 Tax=Streptomyces sp. NPDC050161 TaxID=3365604 RepID=UPI0037AD0BC3
MSPTPSAHPGPSLPASEANEAIRCFVRARRGWSWTAQDMTEYAELLENWTFAVRAEVVEAA